MMIIMFIKGNLTWFINHAVILQWLFHAAVLMVIYVMCSMHFYYMQIYVLWT